MSITGDGHCYNKVIQRRLEKAELGRLFWEYRLAGAIIFKEGELKPNSVRRGVLRPDELAQDALGPDGTPDKLLEIVRRIQRRK